MKPQGGNLPINASCQRTWQSINRDCERVYQNGPPSQSPRNTFLKRLILSWVDAFMAVVQ
jgi:hypothetical protein